jgi:hypothetical protein
MINSTSSSDRAARTDTVLLPVPKTGTQGPGRDQFSADHTAALQSALATHPEVRPEMVARGRTLAADPSYPSPAILRKVGEAIMKSPDLSEDGS